MVEFCTNVRHSRRRFECFNGPCVKRSAAPLRYVFENGKPSKVVPETKLTVLAVNEKAGGNTLIATPLRSPFSASA